MSVRLGIVMDPIASINFKKDSSLAMLLAAQARGWTLFYMEQQDLYQKANAARAKIRPLKVFDDAERWYELDQEIDLPLAELDVILMRKDPPYSARRRPWSHGEPTFCASSPPNIVTSFSNPSKAWAAP